MGSLVVTANVTLADGEVVKTSNEFAPSGSPAMQDPCGLVQLVAALSVSNAKAFAGWLLSVLTVPVAVFEVPLAFCQPSPSALTPEGRPTCTPASSRAIESDNANRRLRLCRTLPPARGISRS